MVFVGFLKTAIYFLPFRLDFPKYINEVIYYVFKKVLKRGFKTHPNHPDAYIKRVIRVTFKPTFSKYLELKYFKLKEKLFRDKISYI